MRFNLQISAVVHPARRVLALFCFIALIFPLTLLADTTSEGWSWGVGCPGDGTSFLGGGSFIASTAGGFSGSGNCSRTATRFTQFTFTTVAGGTTNASTLYGVHTGDWLIVPPTLSTESAPLYMVNSACPVNNVTLNWIFVQWDTSTRILQNTYVLGAASYDTNSGVTVTGQWDVAGSAYWLGIDAMPGACSGGEYGVTGQTGDLDGTIYFTSDGAGVYKSIPGHATFFFPQYTVSQSSGSGKSHEHSGHDL